MGFFDNILTGLQNGASTAVTTGVQGIMNNLLYRWNNASLTGKEREQNAFNAEQAELAYNRSLEADSTKYQRAVADMQAAGINPMLAASGVSGSVQSSPASGSSTPNATNLGDLVAADAAYKRSIADIELTQAQTQNVKADTKAKEQQVSFFEEMRSVRAESERAALDLTKSQRRKIETDISSLEKDIALRIEQTKNEQEKRELIIQQRILTETQAENIRALQPYLIMAKNAEATSHAASAKAALVAAAYQQGMIDNGAIEAAIRSSNADASEKEVKAMLEQWSVDLKNGTLYKDDSASSKLLNSLYQGLEALSSAVLGK